MKSRYKWFHFPTVKSTTIYNHMYIYKTCTKFSIPFTLMIEVYLTDDWSSIFLICSNIPTKTALVWSQTSNFSPFVWVTHTYRWMRHLIAAYLKCIEWRKKKYGLYDFWDAISVYLFCWGHNEISFNLLMLQSLILEPTHFSFQQSTF